MSKTEWLSAPGSPRNEAAERLRAMAPIDPYAPAWQAEMDRLLDEALAAERRATVERIRDRLQPRKDQFGGDVHFLHSELVAILDEVADAPGEAAR